MNHEESPDDTEEGEFSTPAETRVLSRVPTFQSAQEDKKAIKGDKSDIERLNIFGYNKYRFVSKTFIRRNKLSENTKEGISTFVSKRKRRTKKQIISSGGE
jgi:hypothetical protein